MLIFKLYLEGNGVGTIAKYLTKNHIPTPSVYKNMRFNKNRKTRNIWEAKTITDILQNATYIGSLTQNKRRKVNYKSKKMISNPKDKWIIVENTHEAIIDKETFFKVQAIFAKNKNRSKKTKNLLFQGFVYCKECGHKIGMNKSQDGKRYYMVCNYYRKYGANSSCTSHTCRYEFFEEADLQEIKKLCLKVSDKEKYEKILEKNALQTKKIENINLEIEKLDNQIKNNKEALKLIYLDRAKGLVNLDTYLDVYNHLTLENEKNKTLMEELEEKKKKILEENKIDKKDYRKKVEEFLSFKTPNRLLLGSIISKITIDKNKKIDIYYKVKPIDLNF